MADWDKKSGVYVQREEMAERKREERRKKINEWLGSRGV